MQRLILFIIFLFAMLSLQAQLLQAQSNQLYKFLSAFSNDTTAFMKYNFQDRASFHKGRTVNNIIADLSRSNIPVKSYLYGVEMNRDTNGIEVIVDICIYIYDNSLARKKVNSRLKGGKDKIYRIELILETPINFESNRHLLINNPDRILKPEIKNLFGPMKIKELIYTE